MRDAIIMLAKAALASSRRSSSSSSSPDAGLPSSTTSSNASPPPQPQDPTLPDRMVFDQAIQAHHDGLSVTKQTKALIRRSYYNRLLAVMRDPTNTKNEDAQLRWWTRENLSLDSQGRILRNGYRLAIWEDFYDIVAHAHKRAKHGGRDKTWGYLKNSWDKLPKELVMAFIKACPTCIPRKEHISLAPRRAKVSDSNVEAEPLGPRATRTSNKKKNYVDMDDSDDEGGGPSAQSDDEDYVPESGLDQVARAARVLLVDRPRLDDVANLPPPLNREMAACVRAASPEELDVLPDPPLANPPSPSSIYPSPAFSTSNTSRSSVQMTASTSYSAHYPLPHSLPLPHFPFPPLFTPSTGTTGSYNELGRHLVMTSESIGAAYDPFPPMPAPPAEHLPVEEEDESALELSDFIDLPEDGNGEVDVQPTVRRNSPTTLQAATALASLNPIGVDSPNPLRLPSPPPGGERRSTSPQPFAAPSSDSGRSSRTRTSSDREDDDDNIAPPAKKPFLV